ncbi:MAG: PAS domain-containing sensor histidine kinase [Acidimicrobiales bacterium]
MTTVVSVTVLDLVAVGAALVVVVSLVFWLSPMRGRRALRQRLGVVAARLGTDPPEREPRQLEECLAHLEKATDAAAEAVAESTSEAVRLRRALDTLHQAVVIVGENGETVFSNHRAKAMMGGRHGDAIAAQAVEELLESTPTGGSEERTVELYGPPRRTLVVRAESIDNGSRSLGTIAIIEDVSEHRRLEEVRRDFVANVSHELKTPMGAVGLLAETLLGETEPQVAKRLAERIHLEAFRISRVIDDLIDLSRIENESSPPREPVLLNLVMAEAAERVRAAAEQRAVELVVDEPAADLAVLGDRRQLTSAIYNLLENAVKFSYENAKVSLVGGREGDEAVVRVSDTGVGIPARDLERIFERFYRVDPGRGRATGGTGLGLAIVRHVAANHQGSVHVESREGEGSTFVLRLPLQSRSSR